VSKDGRNNTATESLLTAPYTRVVSGSLTSPPQDSPRDTGSLTLEKQILFLRAAIEVLSKNPRICKLSKYMETTKAI
jgi:hypothetical protein